METLLNVLLVFTIIACTFSIIVVSSFYDDTGRSFIKKHGYGSTLMVGFLIGLFWWLWLTVGILFCILKIPKAFKGAPAVVRDLKASW